jgi:DNA-binding NarL/FixJ family response regulator
VTVLKDMAAVIVIAANDILEQAEKNVNFPEATPHGYAYIVGMKADAEAFLDGVLPSYVLGSAPIDCAGDELIDAARKVCLSGSDAGRRRRIEGLIHHERGDAEIDNSAAIGRLIDELTTIRGECVDKAIRRLHAKGLTDTAIGAEVGLTQTTVNRRRRKMGLPGRYQGAPTPLRPAGKRHLYP